MWIVPGLIGAGLAKTGYAHSALLLAAIFLLFWARYPVWLWARSRTRQFPARAWPSTVVAALAGIGIAVGVATDEGRWGLFGFGGLVAIIMAVYLRALMAGHERALATEFLGIAGLGLAGPAAYYSATGSLDEQALLAWLLPTLFFGTSVFAVKLRVEGFSRVKSGSSPRPLMAVLAGCQIAVLMLVAVLGLLDLVTPLTLVVYVPVTIQCAWTARSLKTSPRIKRLGLLWVAHSVLFTVLVLTLV